jgi:hypothetical protein
MFYPMVIACQLDAKDIIDQNKKQKSNREEEGMEPAGME